MAKTSAEVCEQSIAFKLRRQGEKVNPFDRRDGDNSRRGLPVRSKKPTSRRQLNFNFSLKYSRLCGMIKLIESRSSGGEAENGRGCAVREQEIEVDYLHYGGVLPILHAFLERGARPGRQRWKSCSRCFVAREPHRRGIWQ